MFGTSAPSYVKTAFHKVRQTAKDSVTRSSRSTGRGRRSPTSSRRSIRTRRRLARAEVAVEHLEREIAELQANLDREKDTILALRDKVKTGDFRLTGHVAEHRRRGQGPAGQPPGSLRLHDRDPQGEAGDPQGQAEDHRRGPPAARDPEGAEVDLADPAGADRGPAADDRGHAGQERVQLRRAAPCRVPSRPSPTWRSGSTS